MAEKIKIFELDIDVDGALKSSQAFGKEADSLKNKLKELKDAGDTTSKEYVELEARYKSVRSEYNSSQRELGKLINLQGKEIKTIDQGRAALSVISKEWSKQAQLYGVNSKEADKLAEKKTELTERLKQLEKQTGDNTRNVGNYSESMKEAINETGLFASIQQKANSALAIFQPIAKTVKSEISGIKSSYGDAKNAAQKFSGTQKAVAVSTNLTSAALRILKVALIATGIGAIVVLLGSLVAWFSKTQKGVDFVSKAMAALGAAADVIIDRLSKVGGALMKLFSGDFEGAFNDLSDAASGLGDELQREINLAIKLEEVLQRVEKAEVNLDIRRSAANARLKELNKTIEDVSKTEQERLKAAQEFSRIEKELVKEEVSNQEQRVAAMLGYAEVTDDVRNQIERIGKEGVGLDELGLSESTIEDAKEFRDEITKLFDLQTRSYETQTTNQNKLNTIREQVRRQEEKEQQERLKYIEEQNKIRIKEAKEATDAALKESEIRLQIFIEENKGKADSLKESLKIEKQIRDESLEIAKDKLEAEKLTQAEYELEILSIKNEFLQKQSDLTESYAQKEIEAEQQRLEERREREEIEKERKITDLENKREIEAENFEAQLEIEKERLDIQRQQELAEAEKTGADKALINKKYAEIDKQIEDEKAQYKRDVASQTFANMANILGKETAAGKAAAIAQTTIDTYSAATAAYKAMAGIPVVGPALGAIAAASAVASGLQTVKKIASTKKPNIPKAAKGATLRGRSHSQGGETLFDERGNPIVEAEADENVYVLNKRASGLINSLSYLNQSTGGIPLNDSVNYAAAGGMIQKSIANNNTASSSVIDYDLMAEKMAQANMSLPSPNVAVTEINSGQGKYAKVIEDASF